MSEKELIWEKGRTVLVEMDFYMRLAEAEVRKDYKAIVFCSDVLVWLDCHGCGESYRELGYTVIANMITYRGNLCFGCKAHLEGDGKPHAGEIPF